MRRWKILSSCALWWLTTLRWPRPKVNQNPLGLSWPTTQMPSCWTGWVEAWLDGVPLASVTSLFKSKSILTHLLETFRLWMFLAPLTSPDLSSWHWLMTGLVTYAIFCCLCFFHIWHFCFSPVKWQLCVSFSVGDRLTVNCPTREWSFRKKWKRLVSYPRHRLPLRSNQ